MDYEKDFYELCEMLSEEISEAKDKIKKAGGKLSAGDVEYLDKLTHTLKSVKAIMKMMDEEGHSEAYEGGMGGNANRSYRGSYRGGSYRDGSYARGRGRNANRDSMGRYSSEGYSRHGDMVDELRELMEDAPDERTRMEFQKLIQKLENA